MPALSMTLNFKSSELNGLELPVEIRRPDSSLVAQTLSTKPVDLPPGKYYVTARLPGGQRLMQLVTIESAPVTVTLSPDPEDQSPHEWEEIAHYLGKPSPGRAGTSREKLRSITPDAVQVPGKPVQAKVRVFTGNAITGGLVTAAPLTFLNINNFVQGRVVQFKAYSGPFLLQLVEPGAVAQNMMVPSGSGISDAQVLFTRRDDATCGMEAHVHHPVADLMLRFAGGGDVVDNDVMRSTIVDAEQMLASKMADPIAAAIAAYAMLRFGYLRELHDWTDNLCHWFTWLPDGAAIRGEHLARLGKHSEAEAILSELPLRGLPIVADGFFYAFERLKWYSMLDPAKASGIDIARAKQVLKQLERFAPFIHRKRSILSFSGLDPSNPSLTPAPAVVGDPLALDLATWLDDPVVQAASTRVPLLV